MYLKMNDTNYGIVGEQTDFTDSLNQKLYVGDIVTINTDQKEIYNKNQIIVKDCDNNSYEVMGLYGYARESFVDNPYWKIYRAIPYNEIKKGSIFDEIVYCEDKKEMTVAEIEKELGYPIKIVKESEGN